MYQRFANIVFKTEEVLCIHYYREKESHHALTQQEGDSYCFDNVSDISYTGGVSNALPAVPTRIVIPRENVFMIIESKVEPAIINKEEEK